MQRVQARPHRLDVKFGDTRRRRTRGQYAVVVAVSTCRVHCARQAEVSRNDTVTEIPEWPKDKLDRPASFSVFVQGKRRIGAVLHRRKADKDHKIGRASWRARVCQYV